MESNYQQNNAQHAVAHCESHIGRRSEDFHSPLRCMLMILVVVLSLGLAACSSESESDSGSGSEDTTPAPYVPFDVAALPMPNDGYGYDEDGTIALPSEVDVHSDEAESYYQSYDTAFAAIDGWGTSSVIKVPFALINSAERHPLDATSLTNNVMVIQSQTNQVLPAEISSTGSEIGIKPLQVLSGETEYYVVVSDGVQSQDNLPLQADSEFIRIKTSGNNELTEQEQVVKSHIIAAEQSYQLAGGTGNLVYGAKFTTQSVHPVLNAIRENNRQSFISNPQPLEKSRKYDTFTAELSLPFYLPFTEEDSDSCVIDPYDPVAACPELYRWMQPENGEQHLTKNNPLPAFQMLDVPVLIYAPSGWDGVSPLPVTMFVHGITAKKESASTMVKDFVDRGYMVVAIDQIFHGERIVKDSNGVEISAANNSAFFINITSPLTLRGNLHQAVSDQLSLRYALGNAGWVDQSEIHLVGHSLGAIISVMVSEQSQLADGFTFDTASFVVPGQGLTGIMLESLTLGGETESAIKNSPDILRGIAETVIPQECNQTSSNEACITALKAFAESSKENAVMVSKLQDDIYAVILPTLIHGVQTTIDSSDPVSHTQIQRQNQQKTVLIQAKGACGETCEVGEYMPDVVIPNSSSNNLLVGTDPLINALGLKIIKGDTQDTTGYGIRGYINGTVGGHGTYLFPYEGPMGENGLPSIPSGDVMDHVWSATDTQQKAVADMIESQGMQLEIKDESTIEGESYAE